MASLSLLDRPTPLLAPLPAELGTIPCSTCGGQGYITQNGMRYQCSSCGGTGRVTVS